jgi:hypothetical protein
MRTFSCDCGARVFFVNTRCVTCGRELAFLPDRGHMATLELQGGDLRCVGLGGARYRRCANQLQFDVCNWLVPEGDPHDRCQSCRLNRVVPNPGDGENQALWTEVERSKRHLVYTLNQLGLPVRPKSDDPRGLAFEILDERAEEEPVMTGHADGVITLNLREADPVSREAARIALREGYRTVLGHLRHEVGHYYWDLLVAGTARHEDFRVRFGDERADYAAALRRHYDGVPASGGWHGSFISAYAQVHPWEDWAETWAHYLHMIDTLETASHFGLTTDGAKAAGETGWQFDALVDEWSELAVALNALNRSMGMPDAYPFTVSDAVKEKLRFVAEVIAGSSGR